MGSTAGRQPMWVQDGPSCLGILCPGQGCLSSQPHQGAPPTRTVPACLAPWGGAGGRDLRAQGPEGTVQGQGQGVLCSPRKGPDPRTTQSLTSVAPTALGVRTVV